MARGCCGQDTCSCLIVAGAGTSVTGSGTETNPYIISASLPDWSNILSVRDTASVNMTLTGSGRPDDPFAIWADTALKLNDLTDVNDPQGGPSAGEVPVWVGDTATGHWEFQVPPPSPAGAVNANGGIAGTGAAATPLHVATSGTWGTAPLDAYGTDSTAGIPVYVDSNGELRAQPIGGGSVAWADVTGKPSTFTPSAHKHLAADITNPLSLNVGKINGTPIYITPTEDTSWPDGTVWGRPI